MCRRWLALAVIVLVSLVLPRGARADRSTAHGVAVAVLALDSDDAEEQADALTGALRARVRTAEGWSLVETPQSLGMLTAALRCPARPMTAECEQRIADQLKLDRYIYGYVSKGPKPAEVTAEVHLYQRNKPGAVDRQSYSDNLRDQNDEALRKVAERLLDALGGSAVGTVVVSFGGESGEVIVDGEKRVPLENGSARLELSPGSHAVEVAVPGQPPQKQNVIVTAGKETRVTRVAPLAQAGPSGGFPTWKVVGGGVAALGVVAGAIAVSNFVSYRDAVDEGERVQASSNPQDIKLPSGKTADEVCGEPNGLDERTSICKANAEANRTSTVAWVSGAASVLLLGAGAYLFFVEPGREKTATTRIVPTVGRTGGGFLLTTRF